MKKVLIGILCGVMIILSGSFKARADETAYSIVTGHVAAVRYVDLTAPGSGVILPFDLQIGDKLQKDQEIMSYQSYPIYAPEDGIIGALFAQKGDLAEDLMKRYGGIAALEPKDQWQAQASTYGAYYEVKNKTIQLGETLYYQYGNKKDTDGTGKVVFVDGKNYILDLSQGKYTPDESLDFYRDDDYAAKNKVGKGRAVRRSSVLVEGSGRIVQIHVKQGDQVTKGDLLFELVKADFDPGFSLKVKTPENGVLSSLSVIPGQMVYKGQALARIDFENEIEVIVDTDEMDLRFVRVGDKIKVCFDVSEDKSIEGEITEISSLGFKRQNASCFTVHIAIPAGSAKLGSGASVYFPKNQ